MRIKSIEIALLAMLTGGCGVQRHAGPVAANPLEPETRTVEFTQKSDSDINSRMQQLQEDGWAINSFSGRLPQPDGTIRRRVTLSRLGHPAVSSSYDDRRIARITLGETTEEELIEWFGHPESRSWVSDRRMNLAWSFHPSATNSSADGGALQVRLGQDGTVESYQASRAKTLPVQRANAIRFKYDDRVIAKIGKGETSETNLLEWFGRPVARETKSDHSAFLAWQFASTTTDEPHVSGTLNVSLAPDGKVEAYAANRRAE